MCQNSTVLYSFSLLLPRKIIRKKSFATLSSIKPSLLKFIYLMYTFLVIVFWVLPYKTDSLNDNFHTIKSWHKWMHSSEFWEQFELRSCAVVFEYHLSPSPFLTIFSALVSAEKLFSLTCHNKFDLLLLRAQKVCCFALYAHPRDPHKLLCGNKKCYRSQ